MGEGAVGEDLGADGGALVLVAEGGEGAVVGELGEVSDGGGLEEPGGAVVALMVAGEAGEAGGVKPVEVVGEPFGEGGEVLVGEDFGGEEEGERLDDLGEVDCFDDSLWAAVFCGGYGLGVLDAGRHAGGGGEEPGAEVSGGLLGVAWVAGEEEGGGEGGDVEAEVEQGVAVGGEGGRVGGAVWVLGLLSPWAGWVGGVGRVVFGFGVEIVRGAGAAGAEQGGEGDGGLGEVAIGLGEDAIMVDRGDVGAGGGWCWVQGLGGQEIAREEDGSGLGAEGAAVNGHCWQSLFGGRVSRRLVGLPAV